MRTTAKITYRSALRISAYSAIILLLLSPAKLSAQTTVLKDINPGISDADIEYMTMVGDTMYFVADNQEDEGELYITDGTAEGTKKITDLAPDDDYPDIEELTPLGNKLIFTAVTEEHSDEVYVSDGTSSGTYLLKDIYPGDYSSDAEHFGVMNGKAYFPAEDGRYPDADNGEELWVTDGTSSGTYMLKDLDPGQYLQYSWSNEETNHSSRPDNFFAHNGTMYFSARHHEYGEELWATDGTADGTYMVKDIFPGLYEDSDDNKNDSSPTNFSSINGTVLFNAKSDTSYNYYLYTTDGTEEGTIKFLDKEIHIRDKPVEYKGSWYFFSGAELWKSDGTPEGTSLVIDMAIDNYVIEDGSDLSPKIFKLNNQLYFFSTYTLWKTDGTKAGTEKAVESIFNLFDFHHTEFAAVYDGRIYFVASDDGYGQAHVAGRELWMTDGTQEGTMYVANLRTGIDRGEPDGSDPEELRVLNGKLYFTAEGDSLGREIWMTNGIPQRQAQIEDTLRLAEFPNFGATVNFNEMTQPFTINATMNLGAEAEQINLPDTLSMVSNKLWGFHTETTSAFNAEVCFSLQQIDLSNIDTALLSIAKRESDQSEWNLLSSSLTDNQESICASGITSFSDFTIVERPQQNTNVSTEDENLPHSFTLKNAYPNPFNPTTTISYSIPEAGDVRLTVYNLVGQKISTLVNERQSAGSYQIDFDAGQLSSGIYFYRLEAGGQVRVKKMTLLK
ncbi:MAG: T9SS type A sorting domain-containing protein [Gracilimonas sp.]|uniref:T9SS type A sorting domain-containing protein n=1 Tax=Gracilimonas sp. TaxID=1974203 RepID=UPI001B10526B|nr:T9SS type A sorting domain-containing protein [Gracilimonas sp.]MBO6585002.1 T9SS type A sorting domain-containing protein [Gracilimonas sp.]MBO6615727.1 T9SS type A sorting domain-containing protein [Gracilimonas sp.]